MLSAMKRKLQGSRLVGESYKGLDLRSMSAYSSVWTGLRFEDCKMQLADMSGSQMKGVTFRNCPIPLANLSRATLEDVRFIRCDLEQASFAGAVLKDVLFEECRMAYSTFVGATVRSAEFDRSNLHGADLDYIECNEASYHGSNLWAAKAALGCAFWNGSFDADHVGLFAALLAHARPKNMTDDDLQKAYDSKWKMVERLMASRTPSSEEAPCTIAETLP